LKVYNTLAVPTLIYGSEIWTLRKQGKTRLTTSEMKFLRKTAGCILVDHKQNREIIQELQVALIINKIQNDKTKWIQHVSRMDDQRYPKKKMLQYQPRGKRRLGRPLKLLLDDIQLQAKTDHSGLNS
jgi:hypothetical protein